MIELARATHANIRQNITIALGLKGIFLVTTLLGMTGLWLAVLADTGGDGAGDSECVKIVAQEIRQTDRNIERDRSPRPLWGEG